MGMRMLVRPGTVVVGRRLLGRRDQMQAVVADAALAGDLVGEAP
ncbi:MAG: hypothetical protein JWP04_526, partial [Belnapia sp.]|nr:hypothetical protein [Belnapia sp.]